MPALPSSVLVVGSGGREHALALALSFGLGNRDLAGEITREWYERYRAEREAIDKEVATEEAAEGIGDHPPTT